jgi:hypothetical protein
MLDAMLAENQNHERVGFCFDRNDQSLIIAVASNRRDFNQQCPAAERRYRRRFYHHLC